MIADPRAAWPGNAAARWVARAKIHLPRHGRERDDMSLNLTIAHESDHDRVTVSDERGEIGGGCVCTVDGCPCEGTWGAWGEGYSIAEYRQALAGGRLPVATY